MAWKIEWDKRAVKDFKKLDQLAQRDITRFLNKLIRTGKPRSQGAALKGHLNGLWRYRIGKYRVICQIEDHHLVVFVVRTAHRRETYQ